MVDNEDRSTVDQRVNAGRPSAGPSERPGNPRRHSGTLIEQLLIGSLVAYATCASMWTVGEIILSLVG